MVDPGARARNTGAPVRILGSILVAALALAALATHAPTASAAPSRADAAAAKAAVKRAKAAAGNGDYAAAIVEFERARALEPTPQIHFNIGVCHHALMLAADPASPPHAEHRDAAIAAYRAYLDAAPAADDRDDVERIIAEITPPPPDGPDPASDAPPPGPPPALREAVTRIDPDPPAVNTPPPVTTPPPDGRTPARVGPFLPVVIAHARRLGDTELVDRLPLLGLGIRGAAFLGVRERLALGGEFAVYGQPSAARARHRLLDAHVGLTVDYGAPLGRARRFELAGGGLLGFLYESLSRDGATELTCPVAPRGRVAQRGGLLVGGRLSLLLLLGRRRNHELGLRITPALALTGNGSSGDPPAGEADCDQTPFEAAGLPGGAALVTTVDLGYAPRF